MRRQMPCDSCARAGTVKPAHYRCPACARCSCSLPCVNVHKTHYNCTGIRDNSVPLPTRAYNEHKVVSDYSVLEQAKRDLDHANRMRRRTKRAQPLAADKPFDPIPRCKQRVMGEEAAKRAIDLRFMPLHFFRHQNNTSHLKPLHAGAQHNHGPAPPPFQTCMVWRVDVHFCGPSGGTRLVQLHHLHEELNMAHVLERAIRNLEMRKEPRLNGDLDQYLLYAPLSPSNLSAYLRNDTHLGTRRAQPSILPHATTFKRPKLHHAPALATGMELDTRGFLPIDAAKSLRESLHGAMVVEYPILFVAPKGSPDDAHLQSATKSFTAHPEPHVQHPFPRPTLLTTDAQPNQPRSQNAPPAQTNPANTAAATLSPSNHHLDKHVHHVGPLTHPKIPPKSQPRGQKRKAHESDHNESADSESADGESADSERADSERADSERADSERADSERADGESADGESGDSESDLSELEKNIVKRLTPGNMNGGKTGYTCEGKLRVAQPRKPSSVPFSMPKFRSVLPPVGYNKGDTKHNKHVHVAPKDVEGEHTRAADSAESESDSERDSEEEQPRHVRKSVAGEHTEDVNDLENDQSAEEEHESDSDENDNESEQEADAKSEGGLEHEQREEGEDDEQIEAAGKHEAREDGRVTAGRKRVRDSAAQDRPRPLKRQRFEDLEAVELKGEQSVAGGDEEQAKGNEQTQAGQVSEHGDTDKKKRRMPAVSSPPPPFLKVDSVLLETRIPRRKKIPDPNGREPLIC